MKIEVPPKGVAAVYVGKAVTLLEVACSVMGDHCTDCPLNKNHTCVKESFKQSLLDK